ncbi:hypothetical protein ACFX1X_013971 [Malus domestica]
MTFHVKWCVLHVTCSQITFLNIEFFVKSLTAMFCLHYYSEEDDAPPIRAPTLVDKGKAKVNVTEVAKKPIKSEQKEASSDDDDEFVGHQALAEGDSSKDFDESDDDSDSDDDSEEDEETPKKADVGKKRPAESSKTPANDKKPKFVTPEKIGSRKGSVHTATPHPSKQTGKKPATSDQTKQQAPKSSGAFHCQPCNRWFNSDGALQSHTKAKHSAAK